MAGVTKHQGQSTHNYRYDAYGQLLPAHGNFTDPHNHYTFSGKEWDEESRLYYFGARYYDAATGVWLTQDVYRGQVEQPSTLHRTLYAEANPVNNVDAYGYAVSANGYEDSGGGSTAVHPRDSEPNPARQDNHPYEWKHERDEERFESGGGGGGRDEPEDELGDLPRWLLDSRGLWGGPEVDALDSELETYGPVWSPDLWNSPGRLLDSILSGGRYESGRLYAREMWWDIYVPEDQFGIDPFQENVGFYYNSDVNYPAWEGWETQARIQGFTSLPLEYGVVDEVLTRYAVAAMDPKDYGYSPYGLPADRGVYQYVHINEKGYAWITEQADLDPIDADDPATLYYRAAVESQETTGKYDHFRRLGFSVPGSRYEVEGAVPNRRSMQVVGAVNALSLFNEVAGAGDIGDRSYQVLLQENTEGQSRAVIQTYHVFENADYQISPRYLSVDEGGDWQETRITHPYASQAISLPPPCSRSSTCYNIAEPFRILAPLPTFGLGWS